MEPFSISILLTKEEYVQSETPTARRLGWLTITGVLSALAGALLYRFSAELSAGTAVSLLLLGMLLLLCDLVFLPMYARVTAAARFEQQETLRQAVTVTFEAEALTVETARLGGRLPYALLTGSAQTPSLFIFTFGSEWTLRVPRRLLTKAQSAALDEIARRQTGNASPAHRRHL